MAETAYRGLFDEADREGKLTGRRRSSAWRGRDRRLGSGRSEIESLERRRFDQAVHAADIRERMATSDFGAIHWDGHTTY